MSNAIKFISETVKTEATNRAKDAFNSILPNGQANRVGVVNSGSGILRYPISEELRVYAKIIFTELIAHDTNDGNFRQTFTTGKTVALYVPNGGIEVADSAEYSGDSLGLFGQAITNANFVGKNAVNAGDFANSVATSVADAVKTLGGQAESMGVITKVLQRTPMPAHVRNAISSRIGRTANPFLRTIFKQVGMREFQFQFEMTPTNKEEAETINEIVLFFRSRLYPSIDKDESQDKELNKYNISDFVYKFPVKFKLKYIFKDKEDFGHRFLDCYLTSVTTKFNDNGNMTYHGDGNFMSTSLSLTFKEETTLTQEKILQGY